jgi:ABC-type amino acid transport substrate-binding protein
VQLGALAASRAYHTMAMALVVADAARSGATLAEPGDARIGAIGGTLAGTIVSVYRNGKLRAQMVSLSQHQDVRAELDAGTIDAALVTLDQLDAWRLSHPATKIVRTSYLHPLRINIGFVARSERGDLIAAVDRVVAVALANGDLARWHAANGSSWLPPADPQVGAMIGFGELLRD